FENHASSRNSFVGSILSDVGLTLSNFQDIDGGGGWIQYSSEKFVNFFNGDILFVTIAGEADRTMLNELQSEPLWEKLNAVKEGRVYVVDSLTWQGGNLFAANAVIDDLYKYLINTPWPSQ
ncbi:MAG: ABC transporter substrate-binding protein, partial [Cyanobacteria bacterium J06635_15]